MIRIATKQRLEREKEMAVESALQEERKKHEAELARALSGVRSCKNCGEALYPVMVPYQNMVNHATGELVHVAGPEVVFRHGDTDENYCSTAMPEELDDDE